MKFYAISLSSKVCSTNKLGICMNRHGGTSPTYIWIMIDSDFYEFCTLSRRLTSLKLNSSHREHDYDTS